MRLPIFIVFVSLFIFLSVKTVSADVKINEFLVDPQPQMVELLNTSTQSADISRWYIDDSGGATYFTIPENTILLPQNCVVFSSDFSLNKTTSDTIRLFDSSAPPTSSSAKLADSFQYKSSAGPGISYQLFPDGSDNWTTASSSLGQLNVTRFSCLPLPTTSPIPTPTLTPTPEVRLTPSSTPITSLSPTPIDYENIIISEVFVHPDDGGNEWVELYNNNAFGVSLAKWYLDDAENAGSSPSVFSVDLLPYGYGVVELSSSIFNNDADSVRLLNAKKEEIDSFIYSSSAAGISWGRNNILVDSFCPEEPSRGTLNSTCVESTSAPTSAPMSTVLNSSIPPKIKASPSSMYKTTPFYSLPSIHISTSPTTETVADEDEGEVLAAETDSKNPSPSPARRIKESLSFSSFSFSILTIVSVFLRMRVRWLI